MVKTKKVIKKRISSKSTTQGKKSQATSRRSRASATTWREPDSVFFLKLVIFLIVGSQWIYIQGGNGWQIPIPVGLILGLVLTTHEHFQTDRKLEYVVLLFASFISFWLPLGLTIQL